jgi:hypothetical protein
MKLTIDQEFQSLCPALSDEERSGLRSMILEEGCRNPIIYWQAKGSPIIDGHNRFEICSAEGIKYETRPMDFPSRDDAKIWILRNQLSRRNLTDEQRKLARGRLYNEQKSAQGGDKKSTGQNVPLIDKSAEIAEKEGVSSRTIRRDGQFAEAADAILEKAPELKNAIEHGAIPATLVPALSTASSSKLEKLSRAKPENIKAEARKLADSRKKKTDYGKCPCCAGEKWGENEDGVYCSKCKHPHGEPAGDVDDGRLATQRSKTIKTIEALMRAFDDIHLIQPKTEHGEALTACKRLLTIAKGWK